MGEKFETNGYDSEALGSGKKGAPAANPRTENLSKFIYVLRQGQEIYQRDVNEKWRNHRQCPRACLA
jgi:hypothetical protein